MRFFSDLPAERFILTQVITPCSLIGQAIPSAEDCPHVVALEEGRFRAYLPKYTMADTSYGPVWIYEVLCEGGAEFVADLMAGPQWRH